MKKWVKFAALALCLCLLLVGCGKQTDDGKATASTGRMEVEDCYFYTENQDGTYSYAVHQRGGGTLYAVETARRPVSFEVMNEDVLMICGESGVGTLKRWAKFCDIEHNRLSETFAGYLAAKGTTVAFLDNRTNAYHVFVCDVFQPQTYIEVVTLEGLTVSEGSDPVKEYALGKDGVLSVTYPTADGDKTITVDLNHD